MVRRILIKFLLLTIIFSVLASGQSKKRKAILLHQSTGLNYWGINICNGTSTTDIPRQVPLYNDKYNLTDTVSFSHKMFPIGPDAWPSSWNALHYIFDNSPNYPNSWAELMYDTANYGIIHIKTCFAWEAGWQNPSPVYTDEQIETNRDSYHNMSTSKYHIRSIVARMAQMYTVKWVLWTMPPGAQDQNNTNSSWDDSLARWMKNTLARGLDPAFGTFPSNVYIFDLFHHCADANGEMPLVYSCASNNSHPNVNAVNTFSPIIVEETFNWALMTSSYPGKYIIHPYPRKASMVWTPTCGWDMARYDIVMGSHYDTAAVRRARALTDSTYFLVTRDYNQGGIYADAFNPQDVPTYFRTYDLNGNVIRYPEAPNRALGNWSIYSGTHPIKGTQYAEFQADSVYEFFNWSLWDGIHSDGTHHCILPPNGGNIEVVDLDRNGLADFFESGKGRCWIENQWHGGVNRFVARLRSNWSAGGYTNKVVSMWTMGSANYCYSNIIDTLGVKQFNGEEWENAWNPGESNNIGPSNTFDEWFAKYTAWKNNAGQSPAWHIITVGMNGYTGRPASGGERDWWFARFFIGWGCMTDAYICFHHTYNTNVDHESSVYYDEFDIPLGHPTVEATQLSNGAWVRFFDNGAVIFHPGNTPSSITVTREQIEALSHYDGPYYMVVTGQDTTRQGGLFNSIMLTPHQVGTYYAGDALFLLKWQDTVVSPIIVDNAIFPTSPGSSPAVLTGSYYYDALASGQDRGTGPVYVNPTFTNMMHFNSGDAAVFTLAQGARQHYAVPAAPSPTAWAAYTPKINRPGRYILYEWHGWRGSSENYSSEATNARFEIQHAGGTTIAYVNQRINAGQWNMIDTFMYSPTGVNTTTITNQGADGDVIFDALMWVYAEGSEVPEPPEEPPSRVKRILIDGQKIP